MSDRSGLPRHPYPVLLPEAGGFEEAIGRARVRRRRQALEATAMVGVMALFAGGFLVSRPNGNRAEVKVTNDVDRSIDRVEEDRGWDALQVAPTPAAPGAASQQPVPGGGRSGRPGDAPRRPAAVQSPVEPGPALAPAPEVPGRSTKYPVARRVETLAADCRTASGSGQKWCMVADFGETSEAFQYKLTVVICRTVDTETSDVLTFPSEQEVDFEILLKNEVRWTWSKGQRFEPGERNLSVAQSECVAWDVRWDSDDEEGRLLFPSSEVGPYTLRVRSTATQLGDRTATRNFNLQ